VRAATPALILALIAPPALAEDPPPRTTQDGVYTSKQAERGKEGYKQSCAGCHPLDWYRGGVMKSWDGAPLANLLDALSTTMPQNNPGSLKRREYLDLLAYILSLNDMPTGSEELPIPADDLRKIVVKWRSKP
jgi:mono/diheme cytochrome c family protein